jgi:hypothetical protein
VIKINVKGAWNILIAAILLISIEQVIMVLPEDAEHQKRC